MPDCPTYHIPVLLRECVEALQLHPGGCYVDVTFGGGGHSREILRQMPADTHLYSFDQDADAERNIPQGDDRFTFVRSNFRYLRNWMRYYGVEKIDGLLADLGVSSHHFDDEQRGFSFRYDAPLDMRMNSRAGMTAAQLLNTADEEELKNEKPLTRFIIKNTALNFLIKPDFISYDYKGLPLKKRRTKNKAVICWTVTSQEIYDKVKPFADNIIFENFIPER